MLETSQDLLFVILAFSVLLVSIFLTILLYYVIRIVKNVVDVVDSVHHTIAQIDDFIEGVKDKIEKSTSHLMIITELVKQGTDFLKKTVSGGYQNMRNKKDYENQD